MAFQTIRATQKDAETVAELSLLLWPEHSLAEMRAEYAELIARRDCAVFLACVEGEAVGYAQAQLRHDYVEGTESSPVGYLEGVYVREAFRRRGIARALLSACENWAKEMGCTEFASDCELENTLSQAFHACSGFREANRIVCFVKPLC